MDRSGMDVEESRRAPMMHQNIDITDTPLNKEAKLKRTNWKHTINSKLAVHSKLVSRTILLQYVLNWKNLATPNNLCHWWYPNVPSICIWAPASPQLYCFIGNSKSNALTGHPYTKTMGLVTSWLNFAKF